MKSEDANLHPVVFFYFPSEITGWFNSFRTTPRPEENSWFSPWPPRVGRRRFALVSAATFDSLTPPPCRCRCSCSPRLARGLLLTLRPAPVCWRISPPLALCCPASDSSLFSPPFQFASRPFRNRAPDWLDFEILGQAANGWTVPARIQDGGAGGWSRGPWREEVKWPRPEAPGPSAPVRPLRPRSRRGARLLPQQQQPWPRKAASSSGSGARSCRAGG